MSAWGMKSPHAARAKRLLSDLLADHAGAPAPDGDAPIAVVPPAGSARLPRRAAACDGSRCRSGFDAPHKDIADNKACLIYLKRKAPPKEPQGAGLWLLLVARRGHPLRCATALVSRAAIFLPLPQRALSLSRRRDWPSLAGRRAS